MLYVAMADTAMGVPKIVPAEASMTRPAGKPGLQIYRSHCPHDCGSFRRDRRAYGGINRYLSGKKDSMAA